jgi:hypothetical protein
VNDFDQLFMWALRLLGAVVVLRWRTQAAAVAAGLVVWTAIGTRAGLAVVAVGLAAPAVRRMRRDGLQLGRRRPW